MSSLHWYELARDRIQSSGGEPAYMLKTGRKAAGMTQVELAERLHVLRGDVSQMESGKRVIGKALAKKLGKIFGVDYRVFL